MEYTVGAVARLAHVSVRTLHHYDDIGLLSPSGRSPGGYRLYSDTDLWRLRQILMYRELEFGLDEIARMLSDADSSVDDHLRRQHGFIRKRQARLKALLDAIENEMEARQMGLSLTPEEEFEIFGTNRHSTEYADEAKRRWANTDEWKESQRRTAAYTKEDWAAIKAEADANLEAFAQALRSKEPADGTGAMALAEEHRSHIGRWFYECGYAMHRCLADLYISDPRFTETYEAVEKGLAQFVHDAIYANADRAAGA